MNIFSFGIDEIEFKSIFLERVFNDILLVHNIFKTRRIMIEKKQALKGEYPFNINTIKRINGIKYWRPLNKTVEIFSPSSLYFSGFNPFFFA